MTVGWDGLRRPLKADGSGETDPAGWCRNERAILARLRERHRHEPDRWATWENVMRVRGGLEPVRTG